MSRQASSVKGQITGPHFPQQQLEGQSHQYLNKWVWLSLNKTLFTKTHSCQIWSTEYGLLTATLYHHLSMGNQCGVRWDGVQESLSLSLSPAADFRGLG